MSRSKKQFAKRKRHPLDVRLKWWLRARAKWYRGLSKYQKALVFSGPLVLVFLVIPLATFAYFALTMGDIDTLMNRNNTGVVLKDIHGEVFYSTGTAKHRQQVPLNQISKPMQQALVASEDRNFYEHRGFSVLSTLRAVYGYIFFGGGEFGGSTLTQQLAKMTLLSRERGFLRQYQAFSVALAIEQRYSKDQILEMYLNAAYFGNNSFGVEQAARNYFDKQPDELTLSESAMLIGVLPAPSIYSPITGDIEKADVRQGEVLSRMMREKMISEEERQQAMSSELAYQPPARIKNDAPHFTEMALAELYGRYGEERVERSGFQVTTTLDLGLQRQALSSMTASRPHIERMGGSNAGMVAIDPLTGEIRALVGSMDYNNEEWGKVNIVNARRQPGSTFKPIYYAAALADGQVNPATILRDEPIDIGGYKPQNATKRYYGSVTVRQALARSLNIPAVKIMQQYGIEKSITAAKRLGISSLDNNTANYGLALALGTAEVPLLEMTTAYAAFANEGNVRASTTIKQIDDKLNVQVYRHDGQAKRGVTSQGAYLVSSILADQSARSFMFGSSLNIPGKTVAVKSGTTDDNRDAWVIGYTPEIAIGVWVGNNDNRPMVSGGADMAGPIWREAMRYAVGDSKPAFRAPFDIIERYVCYGSGAIADTSGANTYTEVFLSSALPDKTCLAFTKPVEPEVVVPTPPEPSTPSPPAPDTPIQPTLPDMPTEPPAELRPPTPRLQNGMIGI